jgi:hypothetical protein
MSGSATIRITATGTLSTDGAAIPGYMTGEATIRMTANGALMDAKVYQVRYMGTADWPGDSIRRIVQEAQQRAARQLEEDIDDELVCILSAAII